MVENLKTASTSYIMMEMKNKRFSLETVGISCGYLKID